MEDRDFGTIYGGQKICWFLDAVTFSLEFGVTMPHASLARGVETTNK